MKIRFTMFTALLVCALAAPAQAIGPALDWDPAYFWEPGATPTNSIPGSEMKIVGIVSGFGAPLAFLDASDPTKDYTFYVYGLFSNGTTAAGIPGMMFYTTTYSPGFIEVYEGTPRDASFDPNPPNTTVPANFTNGTLILSGTISGFYTQTNNFTAFMTGNAEGQVSWTGGSLFGVVSPGGQPCPSLFTGGLTWYPTLLPAGYLFRHDGKIDIDCPTPAGRSTWGRIKSLYR